jgi:hypothetical protein
MHPTELSGKMMRRLLGKHSFWHDAPHQSMFIIASTDCQEGWSPATSDRIMRLTSLTVKKDGHQPHQTE